VCHCHNCQKQTGTAFSVLVGIPKSTLSVQGKIKVFHDTDGSGQIVNRNFCPECGSPIFTAAAAIPDVAFIKAGSLDDTGWLDPTSTSIATTRSDGQSFPKAVKNLQKCRRRAVDTSYRKAEASAAD
jgi:hypothetical protein